MIRAFIQGSAETGAMATARRALSRTDLAALLPGGLLLLISP